MEELHCTSCKKRISNDKGMVKIACPGCGNYEVIRCQSCRANAAKYTCPSCGFTGPN